MTTKKQREFAFRAELAELLEKHGAELVTALRFVSDAAFGWLKLVGSHPDVVAAIANGTYVPPETKEQK